MRRIEPVMGAAGFSEWARVQLLRALPDLPPEAPAPEPPSEPADPREMLVLPVQGDADESGTRYHWEPRPKGDAGTLTLLEGSGRALQVDLGGVTITTRADGTRELRFAERSQVRAADELPEGIYG
jgi:hypothetical protein